MISMEVTYIDDEGHARKTNVGAIFDSDRDTQQAFESVIPSQDEEGRFLLDLLGSDDNIIATVRISGETYARVTGEPVLTNEEYLEIDRKYWQEARARLDAQIADLERLKAANEARVC